jgi:hypothetical protein
MVSQLFLSAVMVVLTVIFHGYGIAFLGRVLHKELHEERAMHLPTLSPRALAFTVFSALALFVLHGVEIWLYAFLFLSTGAIRTLEIAVYYSTISYAGIGYSDHYIAPQMRLVGGIEGINGLLLMGWSTAFFVTMISRLGR